jgi:hypothetical protein
MLEESYKKWLEREGYQPGTIATSIASTRSAEKKWHETLNVTSGGTGPVETLLVDNTLRPYRSMLKRYSRFLHNVPFPRWQKFDQFVANNFEAAKPQLHGNLTKEPLDVRQWQKLLALLQAREDATDEVLLVILEHLPAFEPRAILEMQVKSFDPIFDDLLAPMKKARSKYLWSHISTTPYGAFARVQRRLKKHAETLGFEIDFRALAKTPPEARAKWAAG